ncbi:MAG: cob(I)yrinic acid a,c-diamide adenosyltransferase [Candidatus Paceibacterota bacterium]
MFYTGNGDKGRTKIFGCNQEFSKSSAIAEALGTVDEINSLLGYGKAITGRATLPIKRKNEIQGWLAGIQQNLFIIQAELAGANKTISREKIIAMEDVINAIEKELPPIKTFFVAGGSELAAVFDFARTVSRRAERRVVAVAEEGLIVVSDDSRAYLNRLSSALYALARLTNHLSGITEEPPHYK